MKLTADTQTGQTLSSATAAKRVTRATAEKALQQFLRRVEQINTDPYFLAKVTRMVLFGSMLKPETDRLSDVDLAVELAVEGSGPQSSTCEEFRAG